MTKTNNKIISFIVILINNIRYVIVRRTPTLHHRKGEIEKWMPDVDDDSTYEVQVISFTKKPQIIYSFLYFKYWLL